MAADASAYATLGLEPGADADAIERAYKRLIKRYHPDRDGGDARRAAEINRAYRELRRHRRGREPLELTPAGAAARRGGWLAVALALAGLSVLLVLLASPFLNSLPASSAADPSAADRMAMDRPLATGAIDGAVRDAVRLAGSRDEMALAQASRDCHQQLRRRPDIAQLDRCAAFDAAVVQLQDRDPLRDRGPFSELAVTGRQMSGATLLSNDYLAIDSRLRRIRFRVELALAPPVPTEPPHAETVGS